MHSSANTSTKNKGSKRMEASAEHKRAAIGENALIGSPSIIINAKITTALIENATLQNALSFNLINLSIKRSIA
jgi:hypothetical protein